MQVCTENGYGECVLVDVVRTRLRSVLTAVCVITAVGLSGCTSNSSFPAGSISAALTPQEADLEAVAAENTTTETTETSETKNVSEPKPDAAKAADTGDAKPASSATQLALAPVEKEPASLEAVDAVAKQVTTPKSKPESGEDTSPGPETVKAAEDPEDAAPSGEAAKKPKGLFSKLFQTSRTPRKDVGESEKYSPKKPAPRVRIVARKRSSVRPTDRERGSIFGLPGVKQKNIFDIEDEIEREEFDGPIQTASIANLATRGRHGLLLQRPDVKVGCFPRPLLRILRQVERRYKRTPIVTSGYRSPRHNRLVRGARKSTHIRCMAADIQVKGVSKWQLAKFLRTLPGRGGVGTYCHTKSVHIDIGSKRAWHYCRRSRKSRRRKA